MVRALPKVALTCEVCSFAFEVHPFRATTARFCSKACWAVRGTRKACENCGAIFLLKGNHTRFCSKPCAAAVMRGPKSSAWKGGASLDKGRAKYANELKAWRLAVFLRDSRTCQHCGAKRRLQAHHLKGWAKYPALRFEVSNGLTVCIDCHGKIHGRDFASQRMKTCVDCSAEISGKGSTQRCRRCASLAAIRRGALQLPRRSPPSQPAGPSSP